MADEVGLVPELEGIGLGPDGLGFGLVVGVRPEELGLEFGFGVEVEPKGLELEVGLGVKLGPEEIG